MTPDWLLSLIVFVPAVAALILMWLPKAMESTVRVLTLGVTVVVFGLTLLLIGDFNADSGIMQLIVSHPWIPSFDIQYLLGVDGISLPLIVLTSFVFLVSFLASWSITKHVKAFCVLFLLLETGTLGVFVSLDFFLFYVFWEVMLLPMYFLIGIWGGPRKEYAAIKFFLYTLLGSVLMLIAILMLYFNSDVSKLAAQDLVDTHVASSLEQAEQIISGGEGSPIRSTHTFNLLALAALGQKTDLFNQPLLWGWTLQHWAFLLLFIGFAVKVPSVPVHTWLPDAHVEAPTPISMILAGVLLKLGGYGILRVCYPICPHAGYDFAWFVCLLGVVSMVYGAYAALAQKDFKRLVAYSSVSHMGYVVLGLGVWSATLANNFDTRYWDMGVKGAMFQMIAHGISSAGMFFMVGVVYDRVHHRDLEKFGGLFGRMPVYTACAMVLFFAGLGLPGLCGFIGEVLVVLSTWKFSHALAIVSAAVVVLTASYILWALQRVYLGAEYKGPHGEDLTPITLRELAVAIPLCFFAVVLGVFPHHTLLRYMDKTIDRQVEQLADWTRTVKQPLLDAAAGTKQASAVIDGGAGQAELKLVNNGQ
ncbi:MAG: NADH-quinone oxidoreductase subunit M [Pirellulales bacterium]